MRTSISSSIARSFRKSISFVVPAALALGAAGLAHAERPNPLADRGQTSGPATPATPAATTGRFTIEQLGQALDNPNFGRNTITNNGETYYTVDPQRGSWKFHLIVSLSPNGNIIWITAPLGNIADPAKASPVALTNLLQKNADTGPRFFEIAGPRRRVELTQPLANHGMTAATLNRVVEDFLSTIQETESLWNPETLSPPKLAANGDSPAENSVSNR